MSQDWSFFLLSFKVTVWIHSGVKREREREREREEREREHSTEAMRSVLLRTSSFASSSEIYRAQMEKTAACRAVKLTTSATFKCLMFIVWAASAQSGRHSSSSVAMHNPPQRPYTLQSTACQKPGVTQETNGGVFFCWLVQKCS